MNVYRCPVCDELVHETQIGVDGNGELACEDCLLAIAQTFEEEEAA